MSLGRSNGELRLRGPALELLDDLVHAMGQPLTALQMCRVLALKGAAEAEAMEDLAAQVESATEVYRALRMLIEASTRAAEVTDLGVMLRRMEADWRRRVDRRGGLLRLEVARAAERVLGGAGTEQALDRIFDAVLSGVMFGTEMEMLVRTEDADLVLSGSGPNGGIEEQAWTLRVARILIESSGGGVVYSGHPVCARVRFARA